MLKHSSIESLDEVSDNQLQGRKTNTNERMLDTIRKKVNPFKLSITYIVIVFIWILVHKILMNAIISKIPALANYYSLIKIACVTITVIISLLVVYTVLKELQGLQNKLKYDEARLKIAMDSTTDGIWDWNIKTNELFLSPQWKKKMGYEYKELPNRYDEWEKRLHPEDKGRVLDALNKYLNKETSIYSVEYRFLTKGGEYAWISDKGRAIFIENGQYVRLVGSHVDISERKRSEEILRETLEENERLLNQLINVDKLKTEFFSNISHDFRTPLNVILGAIHLVENTNRNESTGEESLDKYTGIMRQNCYRLLRLINNLIDIHKIEAGYKDLNLEPYNIISVVEDITLSVKDFVESKDIEEKYMLIDADKFERVMLNLLSNAVKFSQAGGKITVNVVDGINHIDISVKDRGIGIPQCELDSMFKRFNKINESSIKENQGSGIGLSLAKSIVELHGGTIWVESVHGQGTEFFIRLPGEDIGEKQEINRDIDIKEDGKVERINIEFSDIYS